MSISTWEHHRFQSKLYWLYFVTVWIGGLLPVNILMCIFILSIYKECNAVSVVLQHAWVWLLWLLSQTWTTLHIWTPKIERLATTEKLFVLPMYNSFLIDQSLGMNRRRDDGNDVKTEVRAKIS